MEERDIKTLFEDLAYTTRHSGLAFDPARPGCYSFFTTYFTGGAVAQLGARLDGIEEVVGSNPIGSTN